MPHLGGAEGATINFTTEEVIFAAMHHDLGKVGDMDKDYYVIQVLLEEMYHI